MQRTPFSTRIVSSEHSLPRRKILYNILLNPCLLWMTLELVLGFVRRKTPAGRGGTEADDGNECNELIPAMPRSRRLTGVDGGDNMTEPVVESTVLLCDHRVMTEPDFCLTTDQKTHADKNVQTNNDEQKV